MISAGINLAMTVIGFAVSTMFIVFVCTRLICARIHLAVSRRSINIASRSEFGILERGLHGLEPVVVSNFPTKKYGDEFFSTVDDTHCIVCLVDYHSEDMLRILPNCGHSFHVNCIDLWFQQHSTCPICRISLREFSDKKRIMQPLFSSVLRAHRGPEPFLMHTTDCLYTAQNLQAQTVGQIHSVPVQDYGAQNSVIEVRVSIPAADDEQRQIPANKREKHIESPSNEHVSYD
ncbi:hypothetical protein SAY86_017420 [Trapa natans]|uniref:RING-type domain-containing protein n=1 Tax=Trapa natans TaxID=22666 RepID=A0AAN7M547_TRANT|nr:hypothetical protein SAY86_017420 [Trapa natans]